MPETLFCPCGAPWTDRATLAQHLQQAHPHAERLAIWLSVFGPTKSYKSREFGDAKRSYAALIDDQDAAIAALKAQP